MRSMKLFEFNKPLKELHPKICAKIWEWLNDTGKVYFQRSALEPLWIQFSRETFDDNYADPEPDKLERFGEWLSEKEFNLDDVLADLFKSAIGGVT